MRSAADERTPSCSRLAGPGGAAAGLVAPRLAAAQLELDITEGVVEPLPIAISEFYGATPSAAARGRDIADVVSADLERSGLFRPIDRRAFIQTPEQLRDLPRFADWRQINAQALVTGEVMRGEDGDDLIVEFRLWDVFAGTQMRGLRFATAARQLAPGGAQDRRCGLRADHRRDRLFRYPHRLRRRERAGDRSGQAARGHGSGRRQSSLPDRRQRSGADAAVPSRRAGRRLPDLRRARAAGPSSST